MRLDRGAATVRDVSGRDGGLIRADGSRLPVTGEGCFRWRATYAADCPVVTKSLRREAPGGSEPHRARWGTVGIAECRWTARYRGAIDVLLSVLAELDPVPGLGRNRLRPAGAFRPHRGSMLGTHSGGSANEGAAENDRTNVGQGSDVGLHITVDN